MSNSHYYGFEKEATTSTSVNPATSWEDLAGSKRQRRKRGLPWTEEVHRLGKNCEMETVTYIYGLKWEEE